MADSFKNLMIGIFVLAAFAIVVFMMLFLHPNVGNEGKTLRVRFADIDKISIGTRVTFAGKPVGEVVEIEEIHEGERVIHNGIIYIYELVLAIDTNVEVFLTDQITSRTSGLLGEKSVAIFPMPVKPEEVKILATNQVLYANETGSVESVLKEFQSLSGKIEIALDGFNEVIKKIRDENIIENVGTTIVNIESITDTIHGRIESITKNIDSLVIALNQPEKINEILDNFASFSSNGNTFIANIQKGEGSFGKIFAKDDFYLQLSALMSKAEVVLNDINHYGILFHLDKGWQRLRARRLNLLQQLRSPQEFRNYFNDELDSVTTALQRVSMVIEEVDAIPCRNLWSDPCYVKVYSELLRRVAMLEEYLQMYNQQVVDTQVSKTEFLNPCR